MGGTNPVPVQATAAGLADGADYAVRLIATKDGASAYSAQTTFVTVDGDPPTVALAPGSDLTTSSATVNGTVNPQRARIDLSV